MFFWHSTAFSMIQRMLAIWPLVPLPFLDPLNHRKSKEFQKNIYFCFIDYAKDFDCVDHSKLWKILKEMGIPDHLTCLLRNLFVGQEATVRTGIEQQTGSKLGKEYVKAAYLTYMQSTSCEMLGWINHSWNQDCWEKYQQPRYADDTTLMAESEEKLKSLFMMRVKEESGKAGLKLNIQKTKIMAYSFITLWQIVGKRWKQW